MELSDIAIDNAAKTISDACPLLTPAQSRVLATSLCKNMDSFLELVRIQTPPDRIRAVPALAFEPPTGWRPRLVARGCGVILTFERIDD